MDLNNSFANRSFTAGDIYTGQPSNVTGLSNTIKVAYHGVNGVLRIYQSPNGKLWSYYEEFDISGNSFAQSGINGNYYYIQYTHGLGTSTITMATNVSQQIHNNFAVSLTAQDIVTVDGLLFDGDGALIVTGGGGAGGGDASAANQLDQITEAELTNTKLDTINTTLSGNLSVTETNPIDVSALATSAKQDTMITDLGSIVTAVQGNLSVTETNPIDVSALATSAKQDTMITDLGSIVTAVQGNLSVTETNPIDVSLLATSAKQDTMITDLDAIAISVGNTEINSSPIAYSPVHLDLETQGAVVWADSTEDWTAPLNGENGWQYNNTTIGGANAYFYSNTSLVASGVEPDITLGSLMNMCFVANYRLLLDSNPNKKFYIAMTTKPQGAGDFYPGVFRSRKVWELPSSTIVSKGADFLFYAMTDITSFRRDLDHKEMALAISNGPLGVDEVVQFMSINVDSATPAGEFSGILKECYFSTAGGTNRQVVFDNSIARKADLALSKLSVEMGTLQVNMAGFTFNGEDELKVTMPVNTNIKCNDAFLTHTVADTKNCLDVTVNNQLTGFALESTLEPIKLQTDKLTFVDVDTNTGNLKVFDLEANNKLGQFSFFTNEDTVTDLRVRVQNQIEVINPEGQTLAISGNVGLVADQTVGITGSVQAHAFGSTNGTDWHHLKTTATGEVVTHSQTRDGAGTAITSTTNGAIQALDVAISGTPSVTASAGQYGSYGNLAANIITVLPAGVTGGINVSAWSYFLGSYEDYYSGLPGTGSLRLQYSFDNTTYYDLFGTTISPGGVGTPRTATIQKQDIPAINWIRFKNDSSVTLANVTITLIGASL
jgi:hypothetical protein